MSPIYDYLLLPLSLFGVIAIEAMGLQLILGGGGLLTLGHTAFFAIGGYSSASFAIYIGPALGVQHPSFLFFLGILFAMFLSGLAAVVVAIPCLRLRGDYLAVATMGFGQIVENVLNNIESFGGASGFTNIPHFSSIGVIWLFVGLVSFCLVNFYRTGSGHAILCSRDDEIVARCFGISPERSKLTAFILGNIITGLAGALYVHTFQFISPVSAGFQKSVEILLAVVIGGMYSIWGSLLGAAILVLVPELLRFLPQVIGPSLDVMVSTGVIPLKVSHFLMNLSQSSMWVFSLIVLIMIKTNSSGIELCSSFMRSIKSINKKEKA